VGGRIEVAGFDVVRQSLQAKQSIGVVLQQINYDGRFICLGKYGNLWTFASYSKQHEQQKINQ